MLSSPNILNEHWLSYTSTPTDAGVEPKGVASSMLGPKLEEEKKKKATYGVWASI